MGICKHWGRKRWSHVLSVWHGLCPDGSSRGNADNIWCLLLDPCCLGHFPRSLLSLSPVLISSLLFFSCCPGDSLARLSEGGSIRLDSNLPHQIPPPPDSPFPICCFSGFSVSRHPITSLSSPLRVCVWEVTYTGLSSGNFQLQEHSALWGKAEAVGAAACRSRREVRWGGPVGVLCLRATLLKRTESCLCWACTGQQSKGGASGAPGHMWSPDPIRPCGFKFEFQGQAVNSRPWKVN